MDPRRAVSAEAPSIRALVERAYAGYVERIGRRPAPMDHDYEERIAKGRVFVLEDGGQLVGIIVLEQGDDHLLVENVAVDPARQGEGIGRALLAFAEETARSAGLSVLRLYTNAAMTENLALYPRLGYEEVDRRTDNGFERVFFVKRLREAA